jgi:hypothetical protein
MKSLLIFSLLLLQLQANSFLDNAKPGETLGFDAETIEVNVNQRLPTAITYMHIFRIKLQKARIQLPKTSHRIHTTLDTVITMMVATAEKSFTATVDMSYGIRYDLVQESVYLKDPNVEKIVIKGIDPATSNYANTMINSALVAYYKNYPAYRLSEKEKGELDFKVKALAVSDGRIFVTLGERRVR